MHAKYSKVLALILFVHALAAANAAESPAVMLPTVYDGETAVSEYWVSEKLDGVRGRWDGEALWTRGGVRIDAPLWFTAGWPAMHMDGELWIGRQRFAEVSGLVRSQGEDKPWRSVKFMVFDLPTHGGPFSDRVIEMRNLLEKADIPWLQPVKQFRVKGAAELDKQLQAITAAGGEGLMLHHQNAIYHSGRSNHLLKYKAHADAEAQVIGYTDGSGKYTGMLGALVVETEDGRRFRLGTGFSDAERANPPALGSWVTYRYNGLTNSGLPRFARFLRVRHDYQRLTNGNRGTEGGLRKRLD